MNNNNNIKTTKTTIHDTNNKKTDYPNKYKMPVKSIIKKALSSSVKPLAGLSSKNKTQHKVSFPKHISEVIGYGGEWSDDSFGEDNDEDDNDNDDFMNLGNEGCVDDNAANSSDDDATLELKRITRANTDFNMNNGNLLGDAEENIKRSFAALKLGAPQMDKEGKKQTLKINVVPFGSSNTNTTVTADVKTTPTTRVKAKFETKCNDNKEKLQEKQNKTTTITSTTTNNNNNSNNVKIIQNDGENSPPVERAMEKSLLDEISETLEQKQKQQQQEENIVKETNEGKIKFEIKSLSDTIDEHNKPFLDLKKSLLRNTPISKEQAKPKVNVFHKINLQASDTDSTCSDENGVSAYYDVVEAQQCYENLPDGKCVTMSTDKKKQLAIDTKPIVNKVEDKTVYSSSQYITDMLLSSRTRAASYNLHEGNFMTSKITADGLIVTKCNAASDDALDSTGSSFDGSSDEEASYNMTRSESDSGIGISINNHDYKNIATDQERQLIDKKLSASNNSSDYEDIQVSDQPPVLLKHTTTLATNPKSRELHGEPDGSADPDGVVSSLENMSKQVATVKQQQQQQLPDLPKSPPPTKIIDARPSFLHGLQKQQPPMLLKKPDLPAKPALVSAVNSPMKTFAVKRQSIAGTNDQRHQVISQLQMMMSKSKETDTTTTTTSAESTVLNVKDDSKLKKGKAPNPPSPTLSTIAPATNDKLVNSAPPTPERDYSIIEDFILAERSQEQEKFSSTASVAKLEVKLTLPCTVVRDTEVNKSNETNNKINLDTIKTTTTTTTKFTINKDHEKIKVDHLKVGGGTVKEKEKEKRTSVNPKFRSLNTFVTQRQNAAKNLQLQSSTATTAAAAIVTPELKTRNTNNKCLSMSEECLTANEKINSTLSSTPMANMGSTSNFQEKGLLAPKTKTKFSIKKFLRMGTCKTTDNLHKKAEGIYSEICTGDDVGVTGKPRLVIIHPLDINTTAVEVVKDITKTSETVSAQTVAVVTAKPPAPPLRATEGQRSYELNKPARPPPPKSGELRRKQPKSDVTNTNPTKEEVVPMAIVVNENPNGSLKSKPDNVYANLGEFKLKR